VGTVTWYLVPAVAAVTYLPVLRNFVARKRREPVGEARWTLAFCVGLNGTLWAGVLVEYALKRQTPDLGISALGLVLVGARLGLFEWAKRALGENYTIELRRDATALVRSGPYAIVRHPIYLARLMGTVGLAFTLNAFATLCVFGTLDLVAVLLRIRAEERLLSRRFGSEYEKYGRRIGALTPFRALKTLAVELCSRKKEEVGDVHE